MKKRISILALVLAFLLAGCSLAQPEQDTAPDTLVGALMTTTHLSAELLEGTVEDHSVSFPGVDGDAVVCYTETDEDGTYNRCQGGAWFTDGHWAMVDSDAAREASFTGTVLLATDAARAALYCNPVYRRADGSFYALPGDGITLRGDRVDGEEISKSLADTYTETENGKTYERRFSIDVTLRVCTPPAATVLVEMDASHNVLSEQRFAPGQAPETLTLTGAYLVAETQRADGSVTYAIYSPGDETLETYDCAENGLLLEQQTTLVWQDAPSIEE